MVLSTLPCAASAAWTGQALDLLDACPQRDVRDVVHNCFTMRTARALDSHT
ncbi:MAG: hypothetical protein INR62_05860 [Rhodospirillales bacterium]|nr:hypothetical protein [Acetobacter sp.]